jgi:hypothetical protein
MISPDPQQIRGVLLMYKRVLKKELSWLKDRAASRAAERAKNRPSRERARVRREFKQNARAARPIKPKPPTPPRIYGERARILKVQVENKVIHLLLEREARIAKRGLEVVVEELRKMCIEGCSQAEADTAKDYFDEALDKFVARVTVKEQRTAAPNNVGIWSEAAMRAEIGFDRRLVQAGLAEMKKSRSKSEDLQALCENDQGRLALLERAYDSAYLESAKQFLRFLEIVRDEASAGADASFRADYWEGWLSEIIRLQAKTKTRLVA